MTLLFADIALVPGNIIAWLFVGLVSGWLAGKVMKGGGFGVIGDILVGLVGALVGGFVFGFFVTGAVNIWGSIVVSFLGACIAIAVARAVGGRRAV